MAADHYFKKVLNLTLYFMATLVNAHFKATDLAGIIVTNARFTNRGRRMSTDTDNCQICAKEKFNYTCPKCNISYCSVNCYKAPQHLKCSEEFYKSCIQEQLSTGQPNTREGILKMYDILKRIRESDAGINVEDFDDDLAEPLDSDDDLPEGEEEEDEDTDDLGVRLRGIDINNADAVWEQLTDAERADFQKLIDNGDIMKLLPKYKPWWEKSPKDSKIVDLSNSDEANEQDKIPNISKNIKKYSRICKKEPSSCLHYNLWNIITAYACIMRFFSGEPRTNAQEAVSQLINLSSTLKYGTNFEDVEDAIISVEMEALTTGNGAPDASVASASTLVQSREQLKQDARRLMSSVHFKQAALSNILELLQQAKRQLKYANPEESAFQKLYALSNGCTILDIKKIQQLLKKIEFFLSYVNRENDD